MKKAKRLFFFLLCMILVLSGCTKKEENKVDLGGKTFYNTAGGYKEPANIWFGKDGSFVMTDNLKEGTYQISGKWSVKENVVTLDVESTGAGDFTKILFEIKDDKTLTLKTALEGSAADQVFSVDKPAHSSSNTATPEKPKDDDTLKPDTGKTEPADHTTYYNASQAQDDKSFVEIYNDNSFSYTEIRGMGATGITGLVGNEGSVLLFSNFNAPLYNSKGEAVYNFEMEVTDQNTLILLTDLESSFAGDVFTVDGKLPEGYTPPSVGKTYLEWVHGPFPKGSEPSPGCEPRFTLYAFGDFTFTENVYAGMGEYKGWYEQTDTGYILHVDDASKMKGFAGQDVKEIVLDYKSENTLVLKTDLCMSRNGDEFILE